MRTEHYPQSQVPDPTRLLLRLLSGFCDMARPWFSLSTGFSTCRFPGKLELLSFPIDNLVRLELLAFVKR